MLSKTEVQIAHADYPGCAVYRLHTILLIGRYTWMIIYLSSVISKIAVHYLK